MKKFDVKSLKPAKIKNSNKLLKDNSVEFFKDFETVSKAIAQAILEGDREAFHEIVSGFLCVINKEMIA